MTEQTFQTLNSCILENRFFQFPSIEVKIAALVKKIDSSFTASCCLHGLKLS
jgi:hypothetical protein